MGDVSLERGGLNVNGDRGAGHPDRRAPAPAEIDLLWAAASPYPDLDRVTALADRAPLSRVIRTAVEQRVGPLVLRSLRNAGVPKEAVLDMDRADDAVWRAHARLAVPTAAAACLAPLDAGGLAPVVLKGLALAERYPAAGLRPMDDIDLLVPRYMVPPATKLLERAGWRRANHLGPGPGYDVPFVHPTVPGLPLELHYEFVEWRERSAGLSARRLWAARRPALVFGHEAYLLPPELEIVAMIAHAAKGFHCFARLIWTADVAVITRTSAVDWDRVAQTAVESRRQIATAIGLAQARRLGADVPAELTTLPRAIARTHAVQGLLDEGRPFVVSTGPTWSVPYALNDDLSSMLRRAAGDVRTSWALGRGHAVGELFAFFLRGLPRLVRSRISRRGGRAA